MKTLTAKDLLSGSLKVITLDIPELGGKVLIQEPTGHDRSEYEAFVGTLESDPNAIKVLRAYCAVRCLVDEDRKYLFTTDQTDQVNRSISAKVLEDILDKYNGLLLNKDTDIETAAKK